MPNPQLPLSIIETRKRGQSSGTGSPLIGGTTKKATSGSAIADEADMVEQEPQALMKDEHGERAADKAQD